MKKLICFLILTSGILACSSAEEKASKNYEFTKEYTVQITVGGFIGVIDRTFKVGETFKGKDNGESIEIRIAEHTKRNENCPNSWCYQELLSVPKEYLKLKE
ncbi:hypothetical protein OD917_13580 [Flavobacterium sp. SH_e]|uniref:hypothetical protein n=1 Tax=Flavobacterium sp. SH_e TaxID=2983767 RepID=UPI0021E435B7|nr:hypothetical protein [Flavobacterium sp. SH_e]MCV2485961.1 hypothetical protein [Flavobacterium sp. SH_e]